MAFQDKAAFIAYLTETLIPDLRASGSDFTAEDFETAVRFMQDDAGIALPDEVLANALCSGMEGGIGYWGCLTGKSKPRKLTFRLDPETIYPHVDYPMNVGGSVTLELVEPMGDDDKPLTLDRAALDRGCSLMAQKYPKHFANLISDNSDAETGDVLIQLAVFGSLVFG